MARKTRSRPGKHRKRDRQSQAEGMKNSILKFRKSMEDSATGKGRINDDIRQRALIATQGWLDDFKAAEEMEKKGSQVATRVSSKEKMGQLGQKAREEPLGTRKPKKEEKETETLGGERQLDGRRLRLFNKSRGLDDQTKPCRSGETLSQHSHPPSKNLDKDTMVSEGSNQAVDEDSPMSFGLPSLTQMPTCSVKRERPEQLVEEGQAVAVGRVVEMVSIVQVDASKVRPGVKRLPTIPIELLGRIRQFEKRSKASDSSEIS